MFTRKQLFKVFLYEMELVSVEFCPRVDKRNCHLSNTVK
jgi:hypothetical protein